MTPTTQAILQSVASSDPNLTAVERATLQRLISGQPQDIGSPRESDAPLLLTQKQAAKALGISRVTLWRMTKAAIFRPVEIIPGSFRYRRDDIECVAAEGVRAMAKMRKVSDHLGKAR